jgi:hypothetical protein
VNSGLPLSLAGRVRLAALVLLFAAAVWLGLKEGFDGYRGAVTVGQRIAASTQLLYGAAAIPCLYSLFRASAWARWSLYLWMAALTTTGALAPVVWGGAAITAGLGGGLLALAIGGLAVWGTRLHWRLLGRSLGNMT